MKNKNHIESVRIETVADESPDTSWMGKYSNNAETEFAIDRAERGDMGRGEYRFFNPGSIERFSPEATWIPADCADKRAYWFAAMKDNAAKDYARSEAMNRGDFCFVGVIAKAVVRSESGVMQTLRSGGLWGIESDSGADYLASVAKDELSDLRRELVAYGFGERAISHAFKSATTSNL